MGPAHWISIPSRGFLPGVVLYVLGLSASSERVRLSAAELDERQLAPHMPMSNRRGRDSMHTLLIPISSDSAALTRQSCFHNLCTETR
jgi:hypothetical protein